ncbi:hypothetical protein Misp02_57440 [Microtetraspora sp. NBRC 16547]|nr:hypothetical protein Misp02_57440 [Microtetraspora sp. NBRC 16547]
MFRDSQVGRARTSLSAPDAARRAVPARKGLGAARTANRDPIGRGEGRALESPAVTPREDVEGEETTAPWQPK